MNLRKKFQLFSFLLLYLGSFMLFIINVKAINFYSTIGEYNYKVEDTFFTNEENINYARDSYINFAQYDDNSNFSYISGTNTQKIDYYNGIETNNKNIKCLELNTTNSYSFNLYAYNKSLYYSETYFNIFFKIQQSNAFSLMRLNIYSIANISCGLYKYNSTHYETTASQWNSFSAYYVSTPILSSLVDNTEVLLQIKLSYLAGTNQNRWYSTLFYNNFTQNISCYGYYTASRLYNFSQLKIVSNMGSIKYTSIDTYNYISLDSLIESDSDFNVFKKELKCFNIIDLNAYGSLFLSEEYSKFYRWADNIQSYNIINSSSLIGRDYESELFNYYDYGVSCNLINKYLTSGSLEQYNVLDFNGNGNGLLNVSNKYELDSLTELDFSYNLLLSDWGDGNFIIGLAPNDTAYCFLLEHHNDDLIIYYEDDSHDDFDEGILSTYGYITLGKWNNFHIYVWKTSTEMTISVWVNNNFVDNVICNNYDIDYIYIEHTEDRETYLSTLFFDNYDYLYNSENQIISYSKLNEQMAYSKAIQFNITTNNDITFYNPNNQSTAPSYIFAPYHDFYLDIEFDYTPNIYYSFYFGLSSFYRIYCFNNRITIISYNPGGYIVSAFDYYNIDTIGKNIKFSLFYQDGYSDSVQFTLYLDKYCLALNQYTYGNNPTSDFSHLVLHSSVNQSIIMKNLFTKQYALYNAYTKFWNIGRCFYQQNTYHYFYQNLGLSITLPTVSIPDYQIYQTWYNYVEVNQTTNATNMITNVYMDNALLFILNSVIDSEDSNFSSNIFRNSLLTTTSLISTLPGNYSHYEINFHTYITIIYYPESEDIFETIIGFIAPISILILFPIIFYNSFKKWGFIFGLFGAILILAFVNNFSIVQTILLLSIIVLLIIYIYKRKTKGDSANID